jgi:hypothetical protein
MQLAPTAPAAPKGPDTAKVVVAVGALAIGGYLAYKYWYLPNKMREDLARYIASTGLSPQDALARLGAAGCQAYGASYGIPPQMSSGICQELAGAASQLVKQFPQLLSSAGQTTGNALSYIGSGAGNLLTDVGGGVGNAVGSVGGGIGGAVQGILGGVATGTEKTLNVGFGAVGKVYGGAKTVVKDLYNAPKTIVKDTVKTISSGAKAVGHFFGSIF